MIDRAEKNEATSDKFQIKRKDINGKEQRIISIFKRERNIEKKEGENYNIVAIF